MNITKISVSAGLKIINNYNSINSNINITAELEPDEDVVEAKKDLSELAWNMVNQEINIGKHELDKAVA